MDAIQNINELPVATLGDMTACRTAIMCGEDHPWGCKRYEVVKVTSEQGNLVVTQYGWMATEQLMCVLINRQVNGNV